MDAVLPLLDILTLPVYAVAILAVIILGNIVPLGMILALFWYASRRITPPWPVSPDGMLAHRVKDPSRAA